MAQVGGGVKGREVKVAGVVQRHGHRALVLEVEVLDLGANHQHVALVVGLAEDALEAAARVAVKRLTRRGLDVTEDARRRGLIAHARHDLEGGGVREGEHVGFLGRDEALHGRAVEADALLKGLLEVFGSDGERLEVAQHIGKPQAQVPNVALLDGSQDKIDIHVGAHVYLPLSKERIRHFIMHSFPHPRYAPITE